MSDVTCAANAALGDYVLAGIEVLAEQETRYGLQTLEMCT